MTMWWEGQNPLAALVCILASSPVSPSRHRAQLARGWWNLIVAEGEGNNPQTSTTAWEHGFSLRRYQANLKNQTEETLGLKKTGKMIAFPFYPRKIFPDGKIRLQCQKIPTNAHFSLQTEYRTHHCLMNSEKLTLLMCSVTCNLTQPEMNKEASSISRLWISVSVCHVWYIYSLFVNQKDWFRASPLNDGITFSWKLEPCHLSLSGNRPRTIKWSVTTCH